MKILIVSNLYPPHYVGGYELRCAEVAKALCQAGHQVKVLTSRYGCNSQRPYQKDVEGVQVDRALGQYLYGYQPPVQRPYFLAWARPQLWDARYFIQSLHQFKPDVVNWWAISGLTKALLPIPNQRGIPDLFCIDDTWMIEEWGKHPHGQYPWLSLWRKENKPWYWRPILLWAMEKWRKRILCEGIDVSNFVFCPRHVCFVSEFLRNEYEAAGFKFPSTEVIYGGISVERFFCQREPDVSNTGPLRLLYASQITKSRGLHTILDALYSLPDRIGSNTTLTVVGEDPIFGSKYLEELHRKIANLRLSCRVSFIGKKNYNEMAEIYRAHDMLIAPSMLKEGLGLVLIEAMLSGCAVVTSGSGGNMDIAKQADLPLFPKGDFKALSRILEWLVMDRDALRQIAKRGQDVAVREFSFDRMMKQLCMAFVRVQKEAEQSRYGEWCDRS